MPTPPFAMIRIAQDLARDLCTLSGRHTGTQSEVLTDAAKGIWRAITVLETPPPRVKRGERRARELVRRPDMQQ